MEPMMSKPGFDLTRLAAVVADAPDAIIVVDGSGEIWYANRSVVDVFGYEPEELVGRPYALLVPEGSTAVHERHHGVFMDRPEARLMGSDRSLRARHRSGVEFDVGIALVPVPGDEPMVAAIIRGTSMSRRLIARMAATNEILTVALSGGSHVDVEQRSVDLSCRILDAGAAWLLRVDASGEPTVVAACGAADRLKVIDDLINRGVLPLTPDLQTVDLQHFDHLPGSPTGEVGVMVATVGTAPEQGALVVARASNVPEFVAADREVLIGFAGALSITLELLDARVEVERLRSMADHDRIARDLHDTVIQRLFAIAMQLESAVSGATGVGAQRMSDAVDALDEVIRDIRATIFDLRRPATGGGGLRSAIAREIDAIVDVLGFAPNLRFSGLVDAAVSDAVADAASAVVRELLTNAARHADADWVDVMIRTDTDTLTVVVEDDGVGLSGEVLPGDGLANLTARAAGFGGTFEIQNRRPAGVRATWSVPLAGRTEH